MTDIPSLPSFISTESGPFVLEFQGFASVEDYDFAAGYVGAALEYAHRWHLHRETIQRFYAEFIPIAERISGIPRAVDKRATEAHRRSVVNKDKAQPIFESYGKYCDRLKHECTPEVLDDLKVEALRLSRTFTINVTPVERKTTIEPIYYKRADSWLTALGTENLTAKVTALLPRVPGFRPELGTDERITRDSLARLLQKVDENELAIAD